MGPNMPAMSFLTPTFNCPDLLNLALQSLQAQTNPDWEMVVSPDDDLDHSGFAKKDPRIVLVNSMGIVGSGPGAARTRALKAATGEAVACLDDDDQVRPNFVAAALKALKRHPIAVVPSRYVDEKGAAIRTIGKGIASMDIDLFAEQYGTMHTVAVRKYAKPWLSTFAEDVLHTCQMIDDSGGRVPVVASTYLITVRNGSVCAQSRNIDDEYFKLAQSEFDSMTLAGAKATRSLFRKRLDMSFEFARSARQSAGYHGFVLEQTREPLPPKNKISATP
jgi:glycosyltransferase involved in cell wall biosynthesis